MRVLVTGANGIVGTRFCTHLKRAGHHVTAAVRSAERAHGVAADAFVTVGDLAEYAGWPATLSGMDAVVHLAARVHQMQEPVADPLPLYLRANTQVTEKLAQAATAAGVKRFVYVSTAQVNGLNSDERPMREDDPPKLPTPYAVSKWQAEQAVWRILSGRVEAVVVRPPLVYAPRAVGNLLRLMRLVERGWPLPFASITAKRSLVGLDNLANALTQCVTHPRAAGRTFFVTDGEDLPVPQIIRHIAAGLQRPARLIPFPPALLMTLARLAGVHEQMTRLCGAMQVDSSSIRSALDWRPSRSPQDSIHEMTDWYRNLRAGSGA